MSCCRFPVANQATEVVSPGKTGKVKGRKCKSGRSTLRKGTVAFFLGLIGFSVRRAVLEGVPLLIGERLNLDG